MITEEDGVHWRDQELSKDDDSQRSCAMLIMWRIVACPPSIGEPNVEDHILCDAIGEPNAEDDLSNAGNFQRSCEMMTMW